MTWSITVMKAVPNHCIQLVDANALCFLIQERFDLMGNAYAHRGLVGHDITSPNATLRSALETFHGRGFPKPERVITPNPRCTYHKKPDNERSTQA